MNHVQKRKARRIIHGAAILGALVGGGLAQIPASDNAVLVPLEIIMVIMLGSVFAMHLRHSFRTALIVGTAATMLGRAVSEIMVGWIPVLGNIMDGLTAFVVIEVLGWAVAREFGRRAELPG